MSMNLNSLAFLVRDDVTTLSVRFTSGAQSAYIFKATCALAAKLEPGDGVIVKTCNGLKVARVEEIHDEPQIDPEDDVTYQWAFQRVNWELFQELEAQEQTIEQKLKDRRKLSHRQQALAALGITNPSEFMQELTHVKE